MLGGADGPADEGQDVVPVNDWYDPSQPRTATGADSRPEALRGFYKEQAEAEEKGRGGASQQEMDLIGGDDLGHWLLAGARQRQAEREKKGLLGPGGAADEDFMSFD